MNLCPSDHYISGKTMILVETKKYSTNKVFMSKISSDFSHYCHSVPL